MSVLPKSSQSSAHMFKIAIVLVNLGTPDAPTPTAVSRFLRAFLSDTRVVELPKWLWFFILNLAVIPLRRKRVAAAYAHIWQNGDSPMRHILLEQAQALYNTLNAGLASQGKQAQNAPTVQVVPAMRYSSPHIHDVLSQLRQAGMTHFIVLPLFPQFSATSTAPVYDAVQDWCRQQRDLVHLTIIKDYHAHSTYIAALAESVRQFWAEHGQAERLLMSFHGIPAVNVQKGDPYAAQCHTTAERLAKALNLQANQWGIAFQSRFGKQEWVKPYTNQTLEDWGKAGVHSVHVISPAFSADCLETLEELAIENKEVFLEAGGREYEYIPALNSSALHIQLMMELTAPFVNAYGQVNGFVLNDESNL